MNFEQVAGNELLALTSDYVKCLYIYKENAEKPLVKAAVRSDEICSVI